MTPDLLPPRMAAKVVVDEAGCWTWTGATGSRGYGCVGFAGKVRLAHRVAYELLVGPIPEGLQIDHLCRVPSAGTRACSLNVQPNSKAGDAGATRLRTELAGGLRTRRRFAPTPPSNLARRAK